MPEETETTEQQSGAQIEAAVEETTTETADGTEGEETAQEADKPKPAEPFDEARAKAKIRKANSEAESLRKRLKELEPAAAELQRIKDAEKSESERLNDQLTRANEQITKVRQKLVRSRVEALAMTGFADPEDAVGAVDLDSYLNSDGDIDEAAIEADLQALLERKPHWAKAQPQEGPRRPAPDRTQASGANKTRPLDPAEEFAGFIKTRLGR